MEKNIFTTRNAAAGIYSCKSNERSDRKNETVILHQLLLIIIR